MAGFRKLRHVLSRRQTSVDNQEPEEEVLPELQEVRGPPPKQPKIAWEIVKGKGPAAGRVGQIKAIRFFRAP